MDEPDSDRGPAEAGLVECAQCRALIPPSEAVTPEGHDYVLWFCGGECHARWERERAAGTEDAFHRRSGVPGD